MKYWLHTMLKSTILQNYKTISKYVAHPRFITLGHKTLRNELVVARINHTDEQIIDIILILGNEEACQPHTTAAGMMPNLVNTKTTIQTCKHPRCVTCKHYNAGNSSTSTGRQYTIRNSFTCNSNNIIYT